MKAAYGALALLVLLLASCDNDKPDKGPASEGSEDVESVKFNSLEDDDRGREVPTTVYYPEDAGTYPVIVISHGLGGDRSHYTYLVKHLVSHGYVVIVPEHVGSSSRLNAAELAEALYNENEARDRAADISFVLDQAAEWNVSHAELTGKLDMSNIGVTGHSYGGATSFFIGGADVDFDDHHEYLGDTRVRAVAPMAAGDVGAGSPWFDDTSFDQFDTPCMTITGTQDGWLSKKASYDDMPGGDKYFTALQNVDHLDFVGSDNDWDRRSRANIIICGIVTAFFDKFLKGDGDSLKESYADSLCDWQVPDVIWYDK